MEKTSTLQSCVRCGFRARETWPDNPKPYCPACATLESSSPLAPGHAFVWLPETTQPFAAALARTALVIRHLASRVSDKAEPVSTPPTSGPDSNINFDISFDFGMDDAPDVPAARRLNRGAENVLSSLQVRSNYLNSRLKMKDDGSLLENPLGFTVKQIEMLKSGLRVLPIDVDEAMIDVWLENGGTFSGFTFETAIRSAIRAWAPHD
jgi:hypothetical protein